MQSKNSDGFHVLEIIIIAVIVGIIGLVGYNTWNGLQKKSATTTQQTSSTSGGQVCYEKTTHLYCYDISTKKHTEITGAQLPTADTHYIVPSPDASKYLVVAETGAQKVLSVEYYVMDSKMQNPKKLSGISGLTGYEGVAWKSDNSGFYYTGYDAAYPDLDPTDFDNPPSQILFYNLSDQKNQDLTKNSVDASYSNPVLSADGRTLAAVMPGNAGGESKVVTIETATSKSRIVGSLPAEFIWSLIVPDQKTDAIIASATTGGADKNAPTVIVNRQITFADIASGNLQGSTIAQTPTGAGSLFAALSSNYVFHRIDSESFTKTGFDLLPRAGGDVTTVQFKESDGNLLFALPNEQNPLL